MTPIKALAVTTSPQHTERLLESLRRNGWDYACLTVPEWKGFGTKLLAVYEYLREHEEVDRFVFCDAFDVIALGTPEEFDEKLGYWRDKFVLSAERGCWPDESLRRFYEPIEEHGFNFVNSGLYYCSRAQYLDMMDRLLPEYHTDDQLYMTDQFLFERDDMVLDRLQRFFNSHSFIADGEYVYANGRVQVLGEQPVFVHCNGKTLDHKLEEMLKEMGL